MPAAADVAYSATSAGSVGAFCQLRGSCVYLPVHVADSPNGPLEDRWAEVVAPPRLGRELARGCSSEFARRSKDSWLAHGPTGGRRLLKRYGGIL